MGDFLPPVAAHEEEGEDEAGEEDSEAYTHSVTRLSLSSDNGQLEVVDGSAVLSCVLGLDWQLLELSADRHLVGGMSVGAIGHDRNGHGVGQGVDDLFLTRA